MKNLLEHLVFTVFTIFFIIAVAQSVNGPDEIGRIFAVTAFISAILPFVSNPSFRFLFDLTAKVFPQAILIMTSGILFMTVVFNLYLFCSRNNAMK